MTATQSAGRRADSSVQFIGLTPNLVARDIAGSLAFYRDLLGFTLVAAQPAEAPYDFAWLERDGVNVFLNDKGAVEKDPNAGRHLKPGPGGIGLYIRMAGVDAFYAEVKDRVTIADPLETKFYGMREFSITDPDGYFVTFAEERQTGA